jgi:FkbM family methyltransferase
MYYKDLPLEIELLQRIVNKDSICLDIGANTGTYTTFLARVSGAKHVFAFEPEPNNYTQLKLNTQHLDNVTVSNFALSNTTGHKTLFTCPTDNGMHRLYNSKWCEGGEKIRVPVSMVDIIFQDLQHKINFVKIDVEGYEYNVINGMMKILSQYKPIIMMEWHPPTIIEAGADPREFYNLMINELGYYKPKHCLLPGYPTINSYEELHDYTNEIPAINIIFGY